MFLLNGVVWSVKTTIIRYLHAMHRERLPTSSGINLFLCKPFVNCKGIHMNTCPECSEYVLCHECQQAFEEAQVYQQAEPEPTRINIASGEDVCLA